MTDSDALRKLADLLLRSKPEATPCEKPPKMGFALASAARSRPVISHPSWCSTAQAEGYEEGPDLLARRAKAWAAGDLSVEEKDLGRMARANPEAYLEVVVAPNCRWPGRIRAMLDGGGTSFVLVGGDHLFGPEGVLKLLSTAGMRALRV